MITAARPDIMIFTDWGIGKFMGKHRQADSAAAPEVPVPIPEMSRLADAQAALERARQQPVKQSRRQRKRAAEELEAAAYDVQIAAEAAHAAGVSWTQIGDVLGINRATPAPRAPNRRQLVVLHAEADVEHPEAQRA